MNGSASVFTAELHGLFLALTVVLKEKLPKSIIYTDSFSALKALTFMKSPNNPLHTLVLHNDYTANKNGLKLMFCCVPSHIGIPGNEKADRAARTSSRRTVDIHDTPVTDHNTILKTCVETNGKMNGTVK